MRRHWTSIGAGALVVLCVLALAGTPAPAEPADDGLVVPGVRMGRWTLAMSIDDLTRMHGMPIRVQVQAGLPPAADAVYDHVAFTWDRVPVTATALAGGKRSEVLSIGFLSAGSRRFATDKGIAFGATRADVLRAYGEPTAETTPQPGETRFIYDRIGIAFNLSVGRRVSSIAIFRPGTADRYWHLL